AAASRAALDSSLAESACARSSCACSIRSPMFVFTRSHSDSRSVLAIFTHRLYQLSTVAAALGILIGQFLNRGRNLLQISASLLLGQNRGTSFFQLLVGHFLVVHFYTPYAGVPGRLPGQASSGAQRKTTWY